MKRFYEGVSAETGEGGFSILLDGKAIKTPAGAALVVPANGLAAAIVAEWQAQVETIQPDLMPLTRVANTAIDVIAAGPQPAIDEMLGFGASDLLCYRADAPDDLVQRQRQAWDPYLDWVAERFGVRPVITQGIIHIDQPAGLIAGFRDVLERVGAFQLSALHLVTSIAGSLVLALALLERHADGDEIWAAWRVDEDYQAEMWGADDEAESKAKADRALLMSAALALDLLRA